MYILNVVYRAMALDEIYELLCNEVELSAQDLSDCRETMSDLQVPDIRLSELKMKDNLNIASAQDRLNDRIAVLQQKLSLLNLLISHLQGIDIVDQTVDLDGLPF